MKQKKEPQTGDVSSQCSAHPLLQGLVSEQVVKVQGLPRLYFLEAPHVRQVEGRILVTEVGPGSQWSIDE
jgi:hypothetical protein